MRFFALSLDRLLLRFMAMMGWRVATKAQKTSVISMSLRQSAATAA
ncbi:MAG: hypothetical protein AAFN92_18900 [Bacteroidota bacterium]